MYLLQLHQPTCSPQVFAEIVSSGLDSLPQPLVLAVQDEHLMAFVALPDTASFLLQDFMGPTPLYSQGALGFPPLVTLLTLLPSLTFLTPTGDPKAP